MLLPINKSYSQILDKQLITDSRQVINPAQSVFFAIKGKNHDGHQYVPALAEQGVNYFVVEVAFAQTATFENLNTAQRTFIVVENSLAALQLLAAWHRRQFILPVVGITGSNGKTIIKEWLGQLLARHYQVVKSPKSYNSQLGVPLSVWQINQQHDIGIFEAGISKPNEMQRLQAMICPYLGIFTNIGTAHDEGFANREQKILEKLKLFTESKLLIYCKDHTQIDDCIATWQMQYPDVTLFSWGYSPLAAMQILEKKTQKDHTHFQLLFRNQPQDLRIPFIDATFIENSLHCFSLLLCLGFEWAAAAQLLQSLQPVRMRLEIKGGINDCLLIDDTYNNDWAGLQVALNFLQQHKQKLTNTVILSDMLESGKTADELYPQLAEWLATHQIDKLIGIGREISQYAACFTQREKLFFDTTEEFLQVLRTTFNEKLTPNTPQILQFRQENILVKGARSFGFEQIVKHLQAKIHGTVLEINLEALTHNLNYYRSLLKPETKLMVMVKAFAYGSGSFEIAKLLAYQKVDMLAVAYTDEGVALRQQGITLPIMVMNPSPDTFDKLLQYDLAPELYSFAILQSFLDYLQTLPPKNVTAHLKIDTGMHRLGFESQDIPRLVALLQASPQLKIASIFTHLAGADSEEFNDFSLHQLRLFSQLAEQIEQALGYEVVYHACNSAGIVRFQALLNGTAIEQGISPRIGDMVRLGIGLYGVEANGQRQDQLRPIGRLKTIISQIKHVQQGETIGYSRKGKAMKDTQIATIAIGYADGFNRLFSNGKGKVLINKQLAPIIGNVCMDMCMVDITGIDAQEGDEVIIFGKELPIADLAVSIGTIPYEILTAVSERVKRVFLSE